MAVGELIRSESPASEEAETARAAALIEAKSGELIVSNALRARLRRVLHRVSLEQLVMTIAAAPDDLRPPRLVRHCELQHPPRRKPVYVARAAFDELSLSKGAQDVVRRWRSYGPASKLADRLYKRDIDTLLKEIGRLQQASV